MNLLVTGGAGFIGSNCVRLLLSETPHRVVTLDKLTYAGNLANLDSMPGGERHTFVRGDIGDRELVKRLLEGHAIDAVLHFAAESHVDRSIDGPAAFIETNVLGTFHLLESVRTVLKQRSASDQQRFRFLHVSTDEVFGSLSATDPAFHENTPYAPNSPYSASKAASDHLVRAYHHTYGVPVLTTNCSNNYGPYQFPEKLIPLMIVNALHEQPLPVYGDGRNVRDWLYVEDHCRAILTVLERGTLGETYNVGGWNEIENIEIVRRICSELDTLRPRREGSRYEELITYVADRPGHDRRYAMDCRKIERELGWRPRESFDTGIRRTVRWYLDNEPWWQQIRSGAYRGERLGAQQ